MLRVLISDLIAWNRPTHVGSYSVFKPNGTLTPTPTFQLGATSIAKYTFGTAERSPAFPPLSPRLPRTSYPGRLRSARSERMRKRALAKHPRRKPPPPRAKGLFF